MIVATSIINIIILTKKKTNLLNIKQQRRAKRKTSLESKNSLIYIIQKNWIEAIEHGSRSLFLMISYSIDDLFLYSFHLFLFLFLF